MSDSTHFARACPDNKIQRTRRRIGNVRSNSDTTENVIENKDVLPGGR